MLLVLQTMSIKNVFLKYWSLIKDDECSAIISWMFDIRLAEGDGTFLKRDDRKKGDYL